MAERVERFDKRKRATRRASSRYRLSDFLRSSSWNRLQHFNNSLQPRRFGLLGRDYLCGRVAARDDGGLSIASLLTAFNNPNANYGR